MTTLRSHIVLLSDAFCAATGRSRARLSTIVLRGGSRIDAIAGGGDLTTGSYERAVEWFAVNWPDEANWPEAVPRPSVRERAS